MPELIPHSTQHPTIAEGVARQSVADRPAVPPNNVPGASPEPKLLAEVLRQTEAEIARFEARMRNKAFSYSPGERVEFHQEAYEVTGLVAQGMPGYWLRDSRSQQLFLPLGLEEHLSPIMH